MICKKCGKDKQDIEFYLRENGRRRGECKSCKNVYQREHFKRNPKQYRAQRRKYSLKWKYGITEEHYKEMLADQSGSCGICKGPQTNGRDVFDIDHCHKTGEVRGLLCHKCNMGLGSFNDDTDLMELAIAYLWDSRGGWKK